MLFYGYFLVAVVSVLVAWGAIFWLMTRSVYSARRVNGDFEMAGSDASDALRVASEYTRREEERTQTKRLNAIFEADANFHRAA